MWKSMLAGTVALALMGSGAAFAQQRPESRPAQPSPAAPAPQAAPQQPGQPSPSNQQQASADPQAVADGRLSSLRSRLALTPDQEKNWPAFEQAYREFVRLRSERWRDLRAQQRSDNPVENFQAWADFASRRVNGMKRLADAALPLYQSLDQNQQRRFVDQIYDWHPRLARLNDRFASRSGDEGWQGRGYGPGPGRGMGPHWGWRGRGDDDDHDRGYGPGPGRGMGPHWGWRGGDDNGRACGGGPAQRMDGRGGWCNRDLDGRNSDRRGGDWGGQPDEERL